MSFRNYFRFVAIATAIAALAVLSQAQTAGDGTIANMTVGSSSVRWDVSAPNSGGSVLVSFPDGRSFKKGFRAGAAPVFDLSDKQLEGLPEGVYTYELRLAPVLTGAQKDAMMKARGNDDDPEAERAARKRPVAPSLVQHGSFSVINGALVGPGAIEGERTGSTTAPQKIKQPATPARVSANTVTRLRNHRVSLGMLPDDVIPDDLIVQGSACVGLDCVSGEVFGFDTVRLKENNTRLQFDDTSTSAGFPTNNWQIRANSSSSGGASFLAFVDQGTTGNSETGTIVFEVDAGAPANSVKVASTGKVGFRTSTPVLDLHMNTGDTPAMRMEQNNTGGFTAQTWDVAGNEANFFVRDVTSGSRLPFRIRPGAPTSSLDISATGAVGIGTASPTSALTVKSVAGFMTSANTVRMTITGSETENSIATSGGTDLGLDTSGNFIVRTAGTSGFVVAASRVITLNTTNYNNCTGFTSAAAVLACTVSDERVKHGINPFAGKGLSVIRKIQPITFQFNRETIWFKNDRTELGLSAQNLRDAEPLLASSTGNGNSALLQPEPLALHAVEIDAIKQLDARLTALEKENARLRKLLRRRK
jgi:hypothetical protein